MHLKEGEYLLKKNKLKITDNKKIDEQDLSLYIRQTLICIKDKQNLENVKNLTVNVVMLMQLHVEEKKLY